MSIDYFREMEEIADSLKLVNGYMDCEIIILQHIKKQLDDGLDDGAIMIYLKKLSIWFHKRLKIGKKDPDYTNIKFAAAIVDNLIETAK